MPLLTLAGGLFALQPYLGHTQGDLNWHIAGNGVNVLSELDYTDVSGTTVGLKGQWSHPFLAADHWRILVRADLNSTSISNGNYQDSDFTGNNRTAEFSRSVGDVTGTDLDQFQLGFGLRYQITPNQALLGWGGAIHNRQDINFRNGVQVVSNPPINVSLGPINGLDSEYRASWSGGWGAGGWQLTLDRWQLDLELLRLWGTYRGTGRWNLRTDFAQPVSFLHQADMTGWQFQASLTWHYSEQLSFNLTYEDSALETDPGVDYTYFSSGSTFEALFNQASWDSQQWRCGLTFQW
ncbi:MAG: hypothetical protein K6L73_00030 [Cellvibrionaceae bacterium]